MTKCFLPSECLKITDYQRHMYNEYKNLDVLKSKYINHFDIDLTNKIVKFETPVSNNLFILKNVIHYRTPFTSMLIFHVSDKKESPIRFETKNFILKAKVNFSDIKEFDNIQVPFNPTKDDLVHVIVFNNTGCLSYDDDAKTFRIKFDKRSDTFLLGFEYEEIEEQNQVTESLTLEKEVISRTIISYRKPQESGGGVIIEGP